MERQFCKQPNSTTSKTIHGIFEAQVQRDPEAFAVISNECAVRYGELNAKANRRARMLRSQGLGPERMVGICMARGAAMIEALLSILKAGGAYVPMDPAYPAERLREMIVDSEPVAILVDKQGRYALEHALSDMSDAPALFDIDIDADAGDWMEYSGLDIDDQETSTAVENRAYVIYTSGSTGRPKGVEVEHAAVVHLWDALNKVLYPEGSHPDAPRMRVAMNASLSFDVSVQAWSRLLSGDCVVMVPSSAKQDPNEMLDLLERAHVDLFDCTPSQLGSLLDAGMLSRPGLASMTVVVAGEAIPAGMWRTMEACGTVRFFNGYGPTEATVYATAMKINGAGELPRIGVSLPNVDIMILDGDLCEVEKGGSGEIFIGGAGLARGYLRHPKLTAERFIQSSDSCRLYRTGDVGRRLLDGTIEYLGRNDFQVKLRGFRIELGEIEAVLAELPGVQDAIVVLRENTESQKQLVAYYREDGEAQNAESLQQWLMQRLPDFMVPAAYVKLKAWPQTVNGKLDRSALPAPESEHYPSAVYVAPMTVTELKLATLWTELLGREKIGRDDHFMRLGGDSLRLIQLSSRIRMAFEVSLPIRNLFVPQTLAAMASSIASFRENTAGDTDDSFDSTQSTALVKAPLSYQQYGLWILEQLSSTSTAYNAQNVIRIRGRFDPDIFERSLNALTSRHEILRTSFHVGDDGEPYQQVHPIVEGMFEYRECERAIDEVELNLAIESCVQRRFDLSCPPLAIFTLLKLAAEEYVLIQVEQHYVHDGWSMNLILRELLQTCDALIRGEAPVLSPPPAQFSDYARWQNSEAASARFKKQAGYWKNKLTGAALQLPMITDRPRPSVPTYAGGQHRIELPMAFVEQLRAFSQAEGATLYAVMQAVFQIAVSRFASCDDFVIGSAVANRTARKTENMVGMFVNMVPIRCNLSDDPSYRSILQRAMSDLAEAYDNQEAPFEWVVREMQPERDASRNPLFQVAFSSHNSTGPQLKWPDFELEIHEVYSNNTSKFDFDVIMIPRARANPHGVTMLWSYATDLYDHATIERISESYLHLLQACISDPERSASKYDACTGSDRARIMMLSADVREYDRSTPVHARCEAHAARTPDAVAITCDEVSLSYGVLNARSNRLARWLREQGVATEGRVAICMERGIGVVESILAVLKSGAGYVPIDLSYPSERLAYVLSDAKPAVVLVDAAGRLLLETALTSLPADARPRIVDIHSEAELWVAQPSIDPTEAETGLRPEHLAYVIYTSGSTGTPKGVMVEHRQIDRLFATTREWSEFAPSDTVAMFHSHAFDFSVWEIWGALRHGARLVLVPREVARSADAFYALLCREGVTQFNQTPGALRALIEAQCRSAEKHALRLVACGGESLDLGMLRPWFADPRNSGVRLINCYGITETTVISTWGEIFPGDVNDVGPGKIGVRYDDVVLYVLDRQRQLCPFGVIGEIYIGGASVTRGYIDREQLNHERYVNDPFRAGERLYKSGDLARMMPDGSLQYFGRNDFQVKIRGYRIELGEIESKLSSIPGVKEAVVLTRQDNADAPARLLAYFTRDTNVELTADAIRIAIQKQLPEYMVPSAYVEVNAWPMTGNGKLDRDALLASDSPATVSDQDFVSPLTPLEETMAGIWCQLLGVDRVGMRDNFFALGGHSLLATKLMMATQEVLGVDLSLRDLFDGPTIEQVLDLVFSRIESREMDVV